MQNQSSELNIEMFEILKVSHRVGPAVRYAEIAQKEALALITGVEENSESPAPVMSVLAASRGFILEGDFAPAAIILEALYTIAGRDQELIAPILDREEDDMFEGFVILLHNELVAAITSRFKAIMKIVEGEGECECDDNEPKASLDLHIPESDINFEPLAICIADFVTELEYNVDEFEEGCSCDSCRAKLGDPCEEDILAVAEMLRDEGVRIMGFIGMK